MSRQYAMDLGTLVKQLTAILERTGNVDVILEVRDGRSTDEQTIDHVEVFHLHGDVMKEKMVAISAVREEGER